MKVPVAKDLQQPDLPQPDLPQQQPEAQKVSLTAAAAEEVGRGEESRLYLGQVEILKSLLCSKLM